jgi:CheY-like chemotaxis protein
LPLYSRKTNSHGRPTQTKGLRAHFRQIERREWWLWAAVILTLPVTVVLVWFLLPDSHFHQDFYSTNALPQAMRGLAGMVLLSDLYAICQHLLITDVMMPGMNARDLAEQLSFCGPKTESPYFSRSTDSFIGERGVLEPGTHLPHKTFTEEVLIHKLHKVHELLDGRPKPSASSRESDLVGSKTRSE